MKEEKKKESGWPIEDDELDNVSGGMRPAVQGTVICPRCGHEYGADRNKSVSDAPNADAAGMSIPEKSSIDYF